MDFRDSVQNHNDYHAKSLNLDIKFKLPKSKFSFHNIHLNIGNVRQYFSKRPLKSDKVLTKFLVSTDHAQ